MADAEPEVLAADALLAKPAVDCAMHADLRFADGRTGASSARCGQGFSAGRTGGVRGDRGSLKVQNPYVACMCSTRFAGRPMAASIARSCGLESTYYYQWLGTFAEAVRGGAPIETDAKNAVATLRVIDADPHPSRRAATPWLGGRCDRPLRVTAFVPARARQNCAFR